MTRRNIRSVLMSEIDIHHAHSLDRLACRAAVDEVARELSARFGLGGMTWAGDTLSFAGRGVEGRLTLGDGDARVQVRLGPWLGLMRPLIESEIRRTLREKLG
ncbi:MAG: hypothetical protein OJF55_000605 [Rhodanobacteraceae bacterium]|jgi:putative polyhydroxyalkanoate system protein|nr:MAG: hypothetical protein OJF55_000605 [Rhodanobacteraceae bacterium]